MRERVSSENHIERLRLRRAPLAAAALWFGLGILGARLHPHATVQLVASLWGLVMLAIAMIWIGSRAAWISVAGVWFALGIAAADWQPPAPAQTQFLSYADNLSRLVRGRVLRVHPPPPAVPSGVDADSVPAWESTEATPDLTHRAVQLDLAVDEVEDVQPDTTRMVAVAGGARVAVYGMSEASHLQCGDRLELTLRLKRPAEFRTPGAFDYAGYLLKQGIAAHASVSADHITPLGRTPASLPCRLFAAQTWASQRLLAFADSASLRRLPALLRLSRADAEMLNAMLFGDRTGLSRTLRTGFEQTGTFHLFVVSGLHLALVAGGLYWILCRVHAPVWLSTLLTLTGAAVYAALTGFGQPAQRALLMTGVFLLARLLRRDHDPMNALGAATLVLLVLSPSSLYDASLQMTVLVILAIGGIAVPLSRWTPIRNAELSRLVFLRRRRVFDPRRAQMICMLELWGETLADLVARKPHKGTGQTLRRMVRRLPAQLFALNLRVLELALVSLGAELVLVLPMIVYFHRLPVLSVPANLLILPLIGFLLPSALLTFLTQLVSARLAVLPSAGTALLLHAIRFAIHRFSGMQGADLRVPPPAAILVPLAIAAWIGCIWLARRSWQAATAAALAVPLIAMALLAPEPQDVEHGTLELTAIDVGQGDALLVVHPDGRTMLIDAGGPIGSRGAAETVASFDVGEQVVAPYLWSRRIRRLDLLVLTHAHTDHMGGIPAVLRDLRPRELWVGIDPVSSLYRALLAEAGSLGIPVRRLHAGEQVGWGAVRVSVLAPALGYTNLATPRNNDSLVLELQYGRASVLLEGDAEHPSEDAMLAAGLVHPVTLLKVGHHGSKTSSSAEFLAAAQPKEAIISVGRHNSFGHPSDEVIDRLANARTRVFRTDEFGLTTFRLSADGQVREFIHQVPLAP